MKKIVLIMIQIFMLISLVSCAKEIEHKITREEAINGVENYNYEIIPDLKNMIDNNDYGVYFDIVSEDDNQIIVVFRSYTGAINRYYIDKKTGDTYVTEQVPGIIDDETKTNEKFNINNYIKER